MSDKSGSDDDGVFEEAYEVEEIRDKVRGDDGKYLYYVKWKGWESDTNTWEPVEHLEDCPEMLEEFERRWKRKREDKDRRRREEKERKRQERRERELKAAARFKVAVDSDSDGGGYDRGSKDDKKVRRPMSSSESDDDEKDDEKRREKQKKRQEERDRRRAEKEKRREEEKKRQPRYFRDIRPEKILGATTDPGELMFYIKWEGDKVEPGLVKAKECYQKIPQMCLKWYEKHLIWNKPPQKAEVKPSEKQSDETPTVTNKLEETKLDQAETVKEASRPASADNDELDDDMPLPVPAD